MAEIRDELVLEIDQALRQIDDLERALDRSLGAVEVRVDATQAQRQLQELADDADRALSDVDVNIDSSGAARLNDELAGVERNLTQADTEADQLAGSLREADRAAEGIDSSTKALPTRFAGLQTAAIGVASAFAAIGIGQIFTRAIQGANTAIQSFARLEDSINAVNVVFGTAAAGVIKFGEEAARSAGLSQEAFNQAVVPIGSLLQNFGFDAQQAADGAVVLVQRAADLASVMGGSVQDALLAVGAALRGEADPLERYGASISAARVEQFALAEGLARTKAEITPAITLQARYGLILQDTARVAGDFANTAGDLANAQRSAGAELQNFVADIGEDLAPALESILVLLPDLVEGFRQLTPELVKGADSAAAFFESVGEGGGFRTEFAAIRAGLDIVTSGAGLALEASNALAAGLRGDFAGIAAAAGRGGALIEQNFVRGIAVQLASALDKGADSMDVFGDAIANVARSTSDFGNFTGAFQDFAIAANLTDLELRDVTEELIDNASALGLTSQEVAFLVTQLALLNSFLFTDIEAVRQFNMETRALGEQAFSTVTTSFTTFTTELEGGIQSLSSFIVDAREVASAIGEALDPFKPAAEAIDISAKQFFENLVDQVNQQAEAQANIARLIALGFDDVAAEIAKAGPGANRAAEEFLNNLDLAEKAERLLDGEGTAISRQIGDELTAEFASSTMTSEIEAAFLTLIEAGIFTNSQVESAILSGSAQAATQTSTAYFDQLTAEIDGFDATVLEDKLANLFSGVTFDIDASQFNFPDSGAFQGTIGSFAVLGTVPSPQTGITSSPIANSPGSVNVEVNINNPTINDAVSDTARVAQIASSIASSYRSVVPNAM